MASGLVASAHKHNVRDVGRLRDERTSARTRPASARGSAPRASRGGPSAENIAWHSSVSSGGVLAAAKGLNEAMHNETPPNDGHRRNMLSDAYHRIGIDVIRDADGKVWLTEDFAN